MPNHVTNELTINADRPEVIRILEAIKSDEYGIGSIDFNKLIPMPESLDVVSGSRSHKALEIYKSSMEAFSENATAYGVGMISREERDAAVNALNAEYEKIEAKDPGFMELGRKCYENEKNYNAATWYEWCTKNWGTKWNAYGFEGMPPFDPNSDTIKFDTAWSGVPGIIGKIAEMAPLAELTYRYADEDLGANVGILEYRDGRIDDGYFPVEKSKEAYELAADVMGIDLEGEDSEFAISKDESAYIFLEGDEYEIILLNEQIALYSKEKLADSGIPKELNAYHIRSAPGGEPYGNLECDVPASDCSGTVITKEPFDLDKSEVWKFGEIGYPIYTGIKADFRQYLNGGLEQGAKQLAEEEPGGMDLS